MRRGVLTALISSALAAVSASTQADQGDVVAKLRAQDGMSEDYFGWSVAIDVPWVVIGAPYADGDEENIGAAYVFDARTGEQIHKLSASDGSASHWFGMSVGIHGRTVIVGAPGWDSIQTGAAYVFDVETGQQLHRWTPADLTPYARFGSAVAIHSGSVVVGARDDSTVEAICGSAYLLDADSWGQIARLLPHDGGEVDHFGDAVAINEHWVVVGAVWHGEMGFHAGAAYVFDREGALLYELLPRSTAWGTQFGEDVAIDGSTILVGARGHYARLFDARTGAVLTDLQPDAEGGLFASAVDLLESTALVGAREESGRGAVYLFDTNSSECIAKIFGAPGDGLGSDVALSPRIAVVGSPFDDETAMDAGAAYIIAVARCPTDLDGDASVGVGDLLTVLDGWGTDAGDATDDGMTDVDDLLAVLGAWGPCPD